MKEKKCNICNRDDFKFNEEYKLPNGEPLCEFCYRMYRLGDSLTDAKYIYKAKSNKYSDNYLELPIFIEEGDCYYYYFEKNMKDFEYDKMYLFNEWDIRKFKSIKCLQFLTGNYVRKHKELNVRGKRLEEEEGIINYDSTASFKGLAGASIGAERIGILRIDVDHLGKIFSKRIETKTFTRLAVLSRNLTLFFKYYINMICNGRLGDIEPLKLSEKNLGKSGRDISIVYSGGDDLFVIGSWSDAVEFAFDINNCFMKYTGNKFITISGSVVVQKPDYPLYMFANLAEKGEKKAKILGRNRISLFYSPEYDFKKFGMKNMVEQTYTWEKANREVLENLKSFLNVSTIEKEDGFIRVKAKFPHSLIYKLFSVFEIWEREGVLYLPKMGYLLARFKESITKRKDINEKEINFLSELMNKDKIISLRTTLLWLELLNRES